MSLVRALEWLGFITDDDFVVQDDGNGPYIKAWKTAAPKPTQEAIVIAWRDFMRARLTKQVKAVCGELILKRFPLHDQLNGETDKTWIEAMRRHCKVKEGEIAELPDIPTCDAYDLYEGWPDSGELPDETDAPEMEHPEAAELQPEIAEEEVHLPEGPDGQDEALGSLPDEGAEGGLDEIAADAGPVSDDVVGDFAGDDLDEPISGDLDLGDGGLPDAGGIGGDASMVYPGMMVTGDPLKAAQMEKTWRVGEIEAARIDEFDLDANANRLQELRSIAMMAKEGAGPELTAEQADEWQAMEGFAAWLGVIRNHADGLRNLIRQAPDLETLGLIDIESGWPD